MSNLEVQFTPPGAEEDVFPGHVLGSLSIFTTCWWIILMFVFVRNHSQDENLRNIMDQDSYPIAWFWDYMVKPESPYVYLALALFFGFTTQLIVSVCELIAWILYMLGDPTWFVFWASVFGYWGSMVLYALPWVFLSLQIGITMEGLVTDAPGSYTLFLLIVYVGLWILNSVLHLVYVPRMHAYVIATENLDANSQNRCPLRRDNMTDREYIRACQAIARVAKAKLAAE